jgi:hypothetical protein
MGMKMDALNIIFGIVTVFAFAFSLYQYNSSRTKATFEEAKVKTQLERIRHIKYSIVAAGESANSIVQRTKQGSANIDELRNLGRVVRGQLLLIIKMLESEEEKLSHWEYGKMIFSPVPQEEMNKIDDESIKNQKI